MNVDDGHPRAWRSVWAGTRAGPSAAAPSSWTSSTTATTAAAIWAAGSIVVGVNPRDDPFAPHRGGFVLVHGTPSNRQRCIRNQKVSARFFIQGRTRQPELVAERRIAHQDAIAFLHDKRGKVPNFPMHHGGHDDAAARRAVCDTHRQVHLLREFLHRQHRGASVRGSTQANGFRRLVLGLSESEDLVQREWPASERLARLIAHQPERLPRVRHFLRSGAAHVTAIDFLKQALEFVEPAEARIQLEEFTDRTIADRTGVAILATLRERPCFVPHVERACKVAGAAIDESQVKEHRSTPRGARKRLQKSQQRRDSIGSARSQIIQQRRRHRAILFWRRLPAGGQQRFLEHASALNLRIGRRVRKCRHQWRGRHFGRNTRARCSSGATELLRHLTLVFHLGSQLHSLVRLRSARRLCPVTKVKSTRGRSGHAVFEEPTMAKQPLRRNLLLLCAAMSLSAAACSRPSGDGGASPTAVDVTAPQSVWTGIAQPVLIGITTSSLVNNPEHHTRVVSLQSHGSDGAFVISTAQGVYRLQAGQRQWERWMPLDGIYFGRFTESPFEPGKYSYLSLISRDEKSNDYKEYQFTRNGTTWQPIDATAATIARASNTQFHAQDANDIVVVDAGGLAQRSVNGGKSWRNITPEGLPGASWVSRNPENPRDIILGWDTGRAVLLKESNDGGLSWSDIVSAPQGVFKHREFSPWTSATQFAIVRRNESDIPMVTTDGGGTWQEVGLPNETPITAWSWGPRTSKHIYIGTRTGLYRIDSARPQPVLLSGGTVSAVAVSDSQRLCVAYLDGVRLSDDGGKTWSSANFGLPANLAAAVTAVWLGRSSVAVGEYGQIRFSRDAGASWTTVKLPESDHRVSHLASTSDAGAFVVTEHYQDPIRHQRLVFVMAPTGELSRTRIDGDVTGLWQDPYSSNWFAVSRVGSPIEPVATIVVSDDKGFSWRTANSRGATVTPPNRIPRMAFGDKSIAAIAVTLRAGDYSNHRLRQALLLSHDRGQTWVSAAELPDEMSSFITSEIQDLEISDSRILVVTSTGVAQSLHLGKTWSRVKTPATALRQAGWIGRSRNLWIAGEGGLWTSARAANDWTHNVNGMIGGTAGDQISRVVGSVDETYVLGRWGLYRSTHTSAQAFRASPVRR